MNDATIGMLVLVLISAGVATVAHWRIRNYMGACLISAPISAVLFNVAVALLLGHLDKYIAFAIWGELGIAFVVALFVGLFFVLERDRREEAGGSR